jgi:NADPH2:quinone reductase
MSLMATEVREFGGPEVLTPVSLPAPVPAPGEAVIAVSVADVLFLDTMIRSGRARATRSRSARPTSPATGSRAT